MTLPMVLPLPRTSISFGTGAECFLAHTGSASIASGLSVGAFPSKVTVPVMDEAATATPGQNDTVTSAAASHNLFPVPRMLCSLVWVSANSVSVVSLDSQREVRRLYTRPAVSATLTQASRPHGSDRAGRDPNSGVLEGERFSEP